ncbi:hypothetical protein M758_6G159300 [Ceratodon purpureus]|nr:hypothetical protein M758_6G159300 [Ceratodon purpureus]
MIDMESRVMSSLRLVGAFVILVSLFQTGSAQASCSKIYSGQTFAECRPLNTFGATLAWTLHEVNHTIDFAFNEDAGSLAGWVGWGINPTGGLMPGTQALVAFWDANRTNVIVREYDLTVDVAYRPETPLFPANNLSVLYTDTRVEAAGTVVTILSTLHLTPNQSVTLNHVWNRGFRVVLATLSPGGHHLTSENRASRVKINMVTGGFTSVSDGERVKNAHGIINVISWGMLMPIGVMIARYLRPLPNADPLWFHLHRACQTSAYVLGVVGFGLGLKLQTYAPVLLYSKHRNIGVVIFVLATLQVLALVLRPHKNTKPWRRYWNIYHHTIGYTTILLIVINNITGIDILDPGKRFRIAYIAFVAFLVAVAAILEAISWRRWWIMRKKLKIEVPSRI